MSRVEYLIKHRPTGAVLFHSKQPVRTTDGRTGIVLDRRRGRVTNLADTTDGDRKNIIDYQGPHFVRDYYGYYMVRFVGGNSAGLVQFWREDELQAG